MDFHHLLSLIYINTILKHGFIIQCSANKQRKQKNLTDITENYRYYAARCFCGSIAVQHYTI